MNDIVKNLLIWSLIGLIIFSLFGDFGSHRVPGSRLSYTEFLNAVQQGSVNSVTIDPSRNIRGLMQGDKTFNTVMPFDDPFLLPELIKRKVNVFGQTPEQESILLRIFINWFPMILLIGVWIFFMRQMQGGSGGGRGGVFGFGRSRARLFEEDQIKITFADVAGVDEAKEDMQEVIDFLRDPQKFQKLGGKIPRGILLVGPPGTGKTLIAKAVAGEAKVPFFTISGSDFVEMFVGVGASRVRDMFAQAKSQAPCIIFIDEIDAVGRSRARSSGMSGGHDEREQTLNQLLVEMDGFEGTEGIIVMAATNRPDVLDAALLRPGRFDRQITVGLPDIRGREQILKVHTRNVPMAPDVKVAVIARGTPGFSGADLANLVNEAALYAARNNKRMVDMSDLEHARDKIIMGSERRSMVMSDEEKKLTAYHESGHAIVGRLVPSHDPVYKVSIIPRGRALGVTTFLPEQDRYSYTRERLESQITSLFGGRIAEILIFGPSAVTTGASNDISRATQLARNMVTQWGLSDQLGPLTYSSDESDDPYIGLRGRDISDKTADAIDVAVRKIIDTQYARAENLLRDHMDMLHTMAATLLKYETIDATQIDAILEGKTPPPPKDWETVN